MFYAKAAELRQLGLLPKKVRQENWPTLGNSSTFGGNFVDLYFHSFLSLGSDS